MADLRSTRLLDVPLQPSRQNCRRFCGVIAALCSGGGFDCGPHPFKEGEDFAIHSFFSVPYPQGRPTFEAKLDFLILTPKNVSFFAIINSPSSPSPSWKGSVPRTKVAPAPVPNLAGGGGGGWAPPSHPYRWLKAADRVRGDHLVMKIFKKVS